MKTFAIITLLLTAAMAHAQNTLTAFPKINGKVAYEHVVDDAYINTKDVLFNTAKNWINHSAADLNQQISSEDQNTGQIITKGSFNLDTREKYLRVSMNVQCKFTIQIDCRDNKYRIRITDITYRDKVNRSSSRKPLEEYDSWQTAEIYCIDDRFKNIINDLVMRMKKPITETKRVSDNDF
jgi:hypothetical protein